MAQLTLYWPDCPDAVIETIPALSTRKPTGHSIYPIPTGTLMAAAEPYDLIWRKGPALERPVHECAALYERFVGWAPEAFVIQYGLLWSRKRGKRGGEPIENIRNAQRELEKLLAAKNRDDWDAAKRWFDERPRVIQLNGVIGEDEVGRPQLEFRPRHLFGFIVAQLIQDWSGGKKYKFCKNPGCDEYFYYGPGTKHRKTAKYHSKRCNLQHAYKKRKGVSK